MRLVIDVFSITPTLEGNAAPPRAGVSVTLEHVQRTIPAHVARRLAEALNMAADVADLGDANDLREAAWRESPRHR